MIRLIFVVLLVALIGCETENEKRYSDLIRQRQQQAIDQCIKTGGVPIYSSWGPWMKDCQYPPQKEHP